MARISQFLDYITSRWGRDIPLKNLWTVHFSNIPQVAQGVSNILYNTENFNNNSVWPVIDYGYDQDVDQGLLVAQSVVFPQDSFTISNQPNTNMNGLRAGYIGGERTPYTNIQIEFLETNIDIIDHFFRPWIIAGSHKGLIEDGDPRTNIKSDVYVTLYTRINRDFLSQKDRNKIFSEWEPRKTFLFRGVIPINAEGDKLQYTNFDTGNIIKTVSFAFHNYFLITDPKLPIVGGSELFAPNQSRGLAAAILDQARQAAAAQAAIQSAIDAQNTTTPGTSEQPKWVGTVTVTPVEQTGETGITGETGVTEGTTGIPEIDAATIASDQAFLASLPGNEQFVPTIAVAPGSIVTSGGNSVLMGESTRLNSEVGNPVIQGIISDVLNTPQQPATEVSGSLLRGTSSPGILNTINNALTPRLPAQTLSTGAVEG